MGGLTWTRHVTENEQDLSEFCRWITARKHAGTVVGVDSETTGLDVFATGFRLRLVQFGDADDAWLLPVERGEPFRRAARWALRTLPRMVVHNAAFDALAFDTRLGVTVEELWPRLSDTRIHAHLLDSRTAAEGGTGLSLKALATRYVDPAADDGQRALTTEFQALGQSQATGWATIPLDNQTYQHYAAADVVLVTRLWPALTARARAAGVPPALAAYEHRLARIGATIARRGMRLDVTYTRRLLAELRQEEAHYTAVARRYGVTSVHAPAQIAAALRGMGEALTETTASGAPATGREALLPLADLDRQWSRIGARTPNPLAEAVLRAKRAGKWASSYVQAMLDSKDAADTVHPRIDTLGTRTARWTVSTPPLQQLPATDWRLRRCVIAPPGMTVAAADFAQIDLRVLAALAGADEIIAAINAGEDLHSFTTRLVFDIPPGQDVPPDKRKLCKIISLGKAYTGGAKTLARQTGLPLAQVRHALTAYDRALPAIAAFARRLTHQARNQDMTVRTPSGRTLRLDHDKPHTAIAYLCQSTARDLLGRALCAIEDAGLLPYVSGVIHDEILIYAPHHQARAVIQRIGECMTTTFHGCRIESSTQVYGTSWGDGYGCPREARYAA